MELLGFRARSFGTEVALDWATATERDNDHFVVERSQDMINWSEALTVDGAGDSQYTIQYSAVDRAPYMGLSYYRLVQVDHDGTETVSDAVAVDRNELRKGLMVAPNPSSDHMSIMLPLGTEDGDLYLVNELGQRMDPRPNIASDRVELDVSTLPNGVYLLVLSSAQGVFQERVLIQR